MGTASRWGDRICELGWSGGSSTVSLSYDGRGWQTRTMDLYGNSIKFYYDLLYYMMNDPTA